MINYLISYIHYVCFKLIYLQLCNVNILDYNKWNVSIKLCFPIPFYYSLCHEAGKHYYMHYT